jgi:outer membrane immunogenic protein
MPLSHWLRTTRPRINSITGWARFLEKFKMRKLLLAGIAGVAFCGAPAFAADMPVKAPVFKAREPGHDWTGWYGGYNVGIGISQTHARTDTADGSVDLNDAGFTGGVQGGYNWQFDPHWVVGFESDIGYLGIKRSFQDFNDLDVFGVKTNWYGTLRPRLGYTSGPSLFYATGGAAFVNVKNSYFDVGQTPLSNSKIATGWTVGGGIETMLGSNWSAKAEYLYIDAGGQAVFNPNAGALLTADTARFDNRFHVFKFGLNYKFGG